MKPGARSALVPDAVPAGEALGQSAPPEDIAESVRALLDEMDLDPLKGLARVGQTAEQEGDGKLAADCYFKLGSFLLPRLNAVDVDGGLDERIQMGKRAQAWYQKALDRGSRSAGEKMLPSLRIRSRKDKAVQAALLRVQKQVDALPKVPLGISQDDVVKAVKAYGPTPKPKRK